MVYITTQPPNKRLLDSYVYLFSHSLLCWGLLPFLLFYFPYHRFRSLIRPPLSTSLLVLPLAPFILADPDYLFQFTNLHQRLISLLKSGGSISRSFYLPKHGMWYLPLFNYFAMFRSIFDIAFSFLFYLFYFPLLFS